MTRATSKQNIPSVETAFTAILGELLYQDDLPRRTDDAEAKEVPSFLALLDVYTEKAKRDWAEQAGDEAALHGLRKIAAIAVRGMVYCGTRIRDGYYPTAVHFSDDLSAPSEPSVHDREGMSEHDISSEAARIYRYSDGFEYRIDDPVKLWVKRKPDGDSHRVLTLDGAVHYIPSGWRVLKWFPRSEAGAVQF